MDFEAFRKYWNGKYCEVAGSADAKNQCVDLANAYIRDVLRQPIIEWTNAVDFPLRAGDKYEFIKNTPTNVPQKGDIMVWRPSPGHIAIFIEGDAKRFTSFDQNFPVGSTCHVQEHTYTNVDGWLRAKFVPDYSTITIKVSDRDWLIGRATTIKEVATYLGFDNPDSTPSDKIISTIGGYKSQITTLQSSLGEATKEIENRIEQVKRVQQSAEESAKLAEGRENELKTTITAKEKTIGLLGGQVTTLGEKVESLAKEKGALNNTIGKLEGDNKTLRANAISVLGVSDALSILKRVWFPFLHS